MQWPDDDQTLTIETCLSLHAYLALLGLGLRNADTAASLQSGSIIDVGS